MTPRSFRIQTVRIALTALAVLVVPVAVAGPVPSFAVDAGSIHYVNNYFGTLSDTFSFTGPSLAIQGSGATEAAYSGLQSLNVPFAFTLMLAIDDDGHEAGPATAGGTPYASVQYENSSSARLHALSNVTLTSGNLTVSVPGYIDGILFACNTSAICAYGGGTPVHVFDADFGTLTGTLTLTFGQFNNGSTYDLRSAVFTTGEAVPEPASWLLMAFGLGAVAKLRRVVRKNS
jgi:hypothetical protein